MTVEAALLYKINQMLQTSKITSLTTRKKKYKDIFIHVLGDPGSERL